MTLHRQLLATSLCLSLVFGSSAAAASPGSTDVQAPTSLAVEGPITGGTRGMPMTSSVDDLSAVGYTETEYFVSGQAHAFALAPGTSAGKDGRWSAVPAGSGLLFRTRILVRRPTAAKFNGTVAVEWLQELFGTERDVNYRWNADALLRRGFAWVGVSLHHEGVDGDKGFSLARWDPQRYGRLSIPNSDLSYDIYSQVGQLLRPEALSGQRVDPLGGLRPRKLIAVGNSLAAWRLSTYINAVQPSANVFDGFFLQDFRQKTVQDREDVAFPHDRWVRGDVAVPVVLVNMMPAAIRSAGHPTGKYLRIWEPAGASHTNAFHMTRGALAEKRDTGGVIPYCPAGKANDIPSQYFSSAALVGLDRWIKGGTALPNFAPIDVRSQEGLSEVTTDAHGNARGGMRHPWVDVPIARYAWEGECIGGSGRTFALSSGAMTKLYVRSSNYVRRFSASVRAAQRAGKILPEHADAAIRNAENFTW